MNRIVWIHLPRFSQSGQERYIKRNQKFWRYIIKRWRHETKQLIKEGKFDELYEIRVIKPTRKKAMHGE